MSNWIKGGICPKCGYSSNDLTPAEIAVLRAMAIGEGEKAASQALNVTPKTINVHLVNMRRKTKTRSILQLVLFGLRSGILEPPALAAVVKTSAQVAEQSVCEVEKLI